MLVTPLTREDCGAVAELAALSGSGFDPCAELERPWARLWVVREALAAPPVGVALSWRAADELHLLDLAVAPAHRRRGFGQRLLAAVVEDAKTTGARVVLLEVRASNQAALGLYRQAGFVEHGVRRGYYATDGEDALEMRLELEPARAP